MNEIPTAIVVASALVAAATDLWRFRIYNLLTLPLLLSGLVYSLGASGWSGLGTSIAGAAVGFGALIGPYLMGGMGAGDVKLMTGLGAWLGPAMICDVLLASGVMAGLYALVLLASRGIRGSGSREHDCPGGAKLVRLAADPLRRRTLIPFGAAILFGLLATLVYAHETP